MKPSNLPLRVWIPSALALLALFLTAVSMTHDWLRWRHAEERLVQRAMALGDLLATSLKLAILENRTDFGTEWSQLKQFPNLLQTFVIDEADRIVISTEAALIGQPFQATASAAAAEVVAAARLTHERQAKRSASGTLLLTAFPLPPGLGNAAESPARVIYAELDLAAVRRSALGEMLLRALVMSSGAVLIGVVIWQIFRRKFQRRLDALISAAEVRAKAGSWALPTEGQDEIADVARALDVMAAEVDAREASVRNSETQLREAQHVAKMGSWTWEPDGKLAWSAGMHEVFGIPVNQTPTYAGFLDTVHPADRAYTAGGFEAWIKSDRKSNQDEYRIVRPDGSVRHVLAIGEIARGPANEPLHAVGTVQDITDRKKTEQTLRRHLTRQALLLDVTAAVVAAPLSRAALIRLVFEKIAPHLQAEAGFNFRYDGHGLRLVAGLGISPELELKFQTLELGQEFCGTVAATGIPVAVNADLIACDPKGKLLTDLDIRCYICQPLRSSDGRFLGTFSLGSRVKDAFQPDEIEFHQTLCHFISLAWERIAAEEALRASEDRFRSVVEAAPTAMLMTDAGARITLVNRQLERLFGYPREEMIGQPIEMLLPARKRGGHVTQRDGFLRSPTQRPMGEGRELFGVRKDGSEVAIEIGLGPLARPEGTFVLATVFDITERKQAERALRESEARFRELAESINEVFWVSSTDKSRVDYISPAYQTIWGRSCASLMLEPRTWIDSIHSDDRERVMRGADTRQIDGTYDEQYRIIRPDGVLRWIHDRAFPVRDASGTVVRIVGIAEDITEHRLLEEQVRQSQKMEALGQLAGGIAHDFNNILAVFMLQLDLATRLLGPTASPAVTGSLNELKEGAQRAAALTRQLLLFGRREVMQFSRIDLNELLDNLAKMLRRIVGEDIDFLLKCPATPLWVEVDAGMIEQVVVNLCVNARDAMPKGGRLTVESRLGVVDEAHVRSHADARPGAFACLSVSDTGTGIDPAVLPRIFEPFFTTKEVGRGTGLGLATVSGVIKQHQSWIEVETTAGEGTTFRVYLPLTLRAPESTAPVEPVAPAAAGGESETVLLVEDDAMVRLVLGMTLKQHGYVVLEAANGDEGFRVWKQNRREVALVLSDMTMPGSLNGLDLAEKIWTKRPGLPFLIFSGYSNPSGAAKRVSDSNPHLVFVAKPCESARLLKLVRELLDDGCGTVPPSGIPDRSD